MVRMTDKISDTIGVMSTAPLLAVSASRRETTFNEGDNAAAMKNALFLAVRLGNLEEVRSLLVRGADVHSQMTEKGRENSGFGVFHVMGEIGYIHERGEEIVALLCEYGANIEAVDDAGHTALHVCANHFNAELLRILLEHGANVMAVDNALDTALHRAIYPNSGPFDEAMEFLPPSINCLLEYGANPFAVNAKGRMACDTSLYNLPFHLDMGCNELKRYMAKEVKKYTQKTLDSKKPRM